MNIYRTPAEWIAAVRRGEHDAVLCDDWRTHMSIGWKISRWWDIYWPLLPLLAVPLVVAGLAWLLIGLGP